VHKPTSCDSIFQKLCKKITDSCGHWFVKSFLKPVFFILPPTIITNLATKNNLTQQLGSVLNPQISQLLSQSSLFLFIGAYLYLVILKSIYSAIEHYSKPEREINRNDILFLLTSIGVVVGDKMKRFSDKAKEISTRDVINSQQIFFEITQPEQQISLLITALKNSIEYIDQTDSFFRVGLLMVQDDKPYEWACFTPAQRPPRTAASELSHPRTTVMLSIKAKTPILVEDIAKELKIRNKDKRRFLKCNTTEGEEGSQLCYPIIHPATGKVEYVITIAGNKRLCLEEKHLPLYTWLIDHFAMRVSLEHSLLLIKKNASVKKLKKEKTDESKQ
jgi:hypothetical protein